MQVVSDERVLLGVVHQPPTSCLGPTQHRIQHTSGDSGQY